MEMLIDKSKIIKVANKRTEADKIVRLCLAFLALFCASVIVFTVVFIMIKGLSPFINTYTIDGEEYRVDFFSFLIGNQWQNGVAGYGAGYIFINTIYIAFLTMLLTAPISILTALAIVRILPKKVSLILKNAVNLLSGIPSVIFGMFGLGVVTSWSKTFADWFQIQTAGGLGVLTVVLVLTMMSFPTVCMLSISSLNAVDKNIALGSLALGASRTQTNFKAVLRGAKSGIFSGLILGIDRALGEATAVSLISGNAGSGPSFSVFSTTRTLTTTMLTGMSDASGLNYDIRFSAGIWLILAILVINLLLGLLKKKLGN